MKFTKMHGLGNDFIVTTKKELEGFDITKITQELCERRLSVGADGVIFCEESDKADIKMRIINADGSEAEMCGNGIRCFAKFVYDNNIVKKENMTIETLAGIMKPSLEIKNGEVQRVKVNMGKPSFKNCEIPLEEGIDPINITLNINGKDINMSCVLMGVPHTVVFVDDVSGVDISALGPAIEKHDIFLKNTNVNFVSVTDKNNVKIRTWERGAGATLACGTGACSTGIISYLKGKTAENVNVNSAVGTLEINYSGEDCYMTGPAKKVYDGEIK